MQVGKAAYRNIKAPTVQPGVFNVLLIPSPCGEIHDCKQDRTTTSSFKVYSEVGRIASMSTMLIRYSLRERVAGAYAAR